jgi:hypothetical protein
MFHVRSRMAATASAPSAAGLHASMPIFGWLLGAPCALSRRRAYLGIGLSVLQEAEQELARLDGPAALAAWVVLVLGLGGASHAALVAAEGDAALALEHLLEVLLGVVELPALNGKGGLPGVLEVNTQIGAARLRGNEITTVLRRGLPRKQSQARCAAYAGPQVPLQAATAGPRCSAGPPLSSRSCKLQRLPINVS